MPLVKSKYKNPDGFIKKLKGLADRRLFLFRRAEGKYISSTKRVRFDVEQDNYRLGDLKPGETVQVLCKVRKIVMDQEDGTTVVTLSPECVKRNLP